VLSAAIRVLCDGFSIAKPGLYRVRTRGLRHLVGDPDFVLRGLDATLLGEIKVGTKPNSHRYSFQQHRKFMTHGALCSSLSNSPEPVCHLLVVPNSDPRKFCSDFRDWQPELLGHRLRFRDDGKLRAHIADVLRSELARGIVDLNRSRVEEVASLDPEEVVPSFVYTWKEFCEVFRSQFHESGFEEYIPSVERLESFAYGDG
jgi:hypothetical protein